MCIICVNTCVCVCVGGGLVARLASRSVPRAQAAAGMYGRAVAASARAWAARRLPAAFAVSYTLTPPAPWPPGGVPLSVACRGHTSSVLALAVSPDGAAIASAGVDGGVRVWVGASGDLLREGPGHVGPVMALAYSPDGRRLASGGRDVAVCVCARARLCVFPRSCGVGCE